MSPEARARVDARVRDAAQRMLTEHRASLERLAEAPYRRIYVAQPSTGFWIALILAAGAACVMVWFGLHP
jgi:hypothetical protein